MQEQKKSSPRKPYFFMWIVIGIGVGVLVFGGIFKSFVLGAGLGVGIGLLLGLWTEHLNKKMTKESDGRPEEPH